MICDWFSFHPAREERARGCVRKLTFGINRGKKRKIDNVAARYDEGHDIQRGRFAKTKKTKEMER